MVNPPIIGRIVFSFLFLVTLLAQLASAQSRMTVRWSTDERLSVQASGATVASVLSEIARQTNVHIRGLEKTDGTLDIEFAGKHLIEGLRMLLKDFNYLIILNEPAPTIWIHSRIARTTSDGEQFPHFKSMPDEAAAPDTSEQHATTDERDQEQEEQIEAANGLNDASLESLQRVLLTGSPAARIAAMNAMAARYPAAAVDTVAAAIDDPEPALSGAAMQILSQIDHPKATETIGATLRHPNPALRRAALELLFLRNDPESALYLVPIVDDPDPSFGTRAQELMKMLAQSSK